MEFEISQLKFPPKITPFREMQYGKKEIPFTIDLRLTYTVELEKHCHYRQSPHGISHKGKEPWCPCTFVVNIFGAVIHDEATCIYIFAHMNYHAIGAVVTVWVTVVLQMRISHLLSPYQHRLK